MPSSRPRPVPTPSTQLPTDVDTLHLVFAATERHFDLWRRSYQISLTNARRITSYEQLQLLPLPAPTKIEWHILDGFRGAPLIMAARSKGLSRDATYEPIYNTQVPTGERVKGIDDGY